MSDLSDAEIADMLKTPQELAAEANVARALMPMPPLFERPNGRPSPDEQAFIKQAMIDRVSQGEPPTRIALSLNISLGTVEKWAKADADFGDRYQTAKESGNSFLADGLLTVHDKHFNPAMAKIESDNTKWLLGVRDRNVYGAKVEVTDTASAGLVDVLKAAIARIPRPNAGPTLDLATIEDAQVIDINELMS